MNASQTDDQKIIEIIHRGDSFKQLLSDPIFKEGIMEAKRALFEQIANSNMDQPELREQCYLIIHSLNKVHDIMTETISEATYLQDQINTSQENDNE